MYDGEYQLRKDVDRLQLKIADMGEDVGLSYSLIPNVAGVIYRNGEPTPPSLSFSSYITTEEGISFVDGVLEILSSTDGNEWVGEKTVEGHVISIVPSQSVKYYKCTFSIDDVIFDVETVPVLSETEENVNVFLDNEAQVIPCTVDGLTKQNMTVTIKYNAYKGISRIPISLDEESLVLDTGFTTVSNTNGTVSHEGTLVLSVAGNIDIASSGTVTLPLTVEDIVFDKVFRWGKVCDGLKGDKGDAGEQGIQGEQGEKGEDGDSIQYIFARTETTAVFDSSNPDIYLATPDNTTVIHEGVDNDNSRMTWWEDPQEINGLCKYQWVSQRTKENEVWGEWSIPTLWAVFSQDGDVGDTGDKGDKGDKGENGLGFDEDTLENVNRIANGDIDASTFCGLTPDKFTSATVEEWSAYDFCGSGSTLSLKKIGRFVLLNMNSCSGTTTSPTGWLTVNPNDPIPEIFRPPSLVYCHNGLFNGMAIQNDGLIKLKFKDNASGLTRGLAADDQTFTFVSGSLMYIVNETNLNSSLAVTSPSTASSFSITTSDTIKFALLDYNGNPLSNKTIKITVSSNKWSSSKSYNLSTDNNGLVEFVMNVVDGVYTLVAEYSAVGWSTQTCTVTVTVNKANVATTRTFDSTTKKGTVEVYNSSSKTTRLKNCNGYLQYDGGTKSPVNTGSKGEFTYDMSEYKYGNHTLEWGWFDSSRASDSSASWKWEYETGVNAPTITTVSSYGSNVEYDSEDAQYYTYADWDLYDASLLSADDKRAMTAQLYSPSDDRYVYNQIMPINITGFDFDIPSTATVTNVELQFKYGCFGNVSVADPPTLYLGWELWSVNDKGWNIYMRNTMYQMDVLPYMNFANYNRYIYGSVNFDWFTHYEEFNYPITPEMMNYDDLRLKVFTWNGSDTYDSVTFALDLVKINVTYEE